MAKSSGYQTLARRYRPKRFRDVVGQESTLTTLKNALRLDKAAHAYLFCGSRGVGKTTLARLFAKALNCPNRGSDMEPCNSCSSCAEIASGQSLDVIEIDGASNRGIDDIRQINETAGYAPSHGKYKIYIIDEVHMLTKEAFNALLKTLEEPPERAKFFFATTEPHKVLPTIISRCQRFDLLRINDEAIAAKLGQISQEAGRDVEPEALHLIASFADGSLRDAESLFDQILCFESAKITKETIQQALGLIPQDRFFAIDQAFSQCDLLHAFELVEQLFQAGKDLTHFFEQLVDHYRKLLVCKTIGEKGVAAHLAKAYADAARLYTQGQLLYILDHLIQAEARMQKSSFPRVALESILLHIIRSKNRVPIEVIARRLSELENVLQQEGKRDIPSPPPAEIPPEPSPSMERAARLESIPSGLAQASDPSICGKELTALNQSEESPSSQEGVLQLYSAQPVQAEPAPSTAPLPLDLQPIPFKDPANDREQVKENKTAAAAEQPKQGKHPSHYDTVMRFAAIELEGAFKKE